MYRPKHPSAQKRSIYQFYDENTENMFTYILPKQFAYSLHFPWYPFCRQLKTTQIISRSFTISNKLGNFHWKLLNCKMFRKLQKTRRTREISWNLQELPEQKSWKIHLRCLRCFFAVFLMFVKLMLIFLNFLWSTALLDTQAKKSRKVFGGNSSSVK